MDVRTAGTILLTCALFQLSVHAVDKIDFNTQIRPILSNKCFNCHGPDAKARKGGDKKTGGLRLDNGKGAFNGEIIVARIDDEVTLKRFKKDNKGLRLIAENKNYDDILVDKSSNFAIEGKAVGILRENI